MNLNYHEKRIIQIIPATGWYAIHGDDLRIALVAWALVEYEDGTQAVAGIEASPSEANTEFSEDLSKSFRGYVYQAVGAIGRFEAAYASQMIEVSA